MQPATRSREVDRPGRRTPSCHPPAAAPTAPIQNLASHQRIRKRESDPAHHFGQRTSRCGVKGCSEPSTHSISGQSACVASSGKLQYDKRSANGDAGRYMHLQSHRLPFVRDWSRHYGLIVTRPAASKVYEGDLRSKRRRCNVWSPV